MIDAAPGQKRWPPTKDIFAATKYKVAIEQDNRHDA